MFSSAGFLWVWTSSLTNSSIAADVIRNGQVVSVTANVYPSSISPITVHVLARGTTVEVFGQRDNRLWVKFSKGLQKLEGWVDRGTIAVGSLSQAPQALQSKVYPGAVTSESCAVREEADPRSKILGQLPRDSAVNVISQTAQWYRIRYVFGNGAVGSAWVSKTDVTLQKVTSATAQEKVSKPDESESTQWRQDDRRSHPIKINGLRVLMAPVLSLKRFGSTQFRLGAAWDFPISEKISLGIPVAYSSGGGFYSILGGLDLTMLLWSHESFGLLGRIGTYVERFAGGTRSLSFMAATVDAGIGAQYQFSDHFSVILEPAAVEVSSFATHNVPWFMRLQIGTALRASW